MVCICCTFSKIQEATYKNISFRPKQTKRIVFSWLKLNRYNFFLFSPEILAHLSCVILIFYSVWSLSNEKKLGSRVFRKRTKQKARNISFKLFWVNPSYEICGCQRNSDKFGNTTNLPKFFCVFKIKNRPVLYFISLSY